jgi:glycosyltransferase involved in cell wall biosynthesis
MLDTLQESLRPSSASVLADTSIIIPAYNEEGGIGQTLDSLCNHPELQDAEIIVIDDGSIDRTKEIVQCFDRVRLIRHVRNRGYGAAIADGVKASSRSYVAWFDADGQHRVEDLVAVIDALAINDWDYCIGVRDKRSHGVRNRKVGKFILKHSVNLMAGQPVKDFNSGLRAFRRDVILPYVHLLPRGFGASTTTTLLMLERRYFGGDVPIVVQPRIGKSSVSPIRDGLLTLLLLLRIFLLFKPMVFFGGIGLTLIATGCIYGFYEAIRFREGFPVFAALIIILGVQSLFFGLLSDQVSTMRRERFEHPDLHT